MEASVQCSDCSQYLTNNDIVYVSTKCGHVYHQKCLHDKFKQDSRLCGGQYNCSLICYPRYCRRVYLYFNSFNWVYIEPKIFKTDETVLGARILKLGSNTKGHSIYAARVFLQDKATSCYYNAETQIAYQDFECYLECSAPKQFELLDISNDAGYEYIWEECKTPASNGYYRENQNGLLRISRVAVDE